MVRAGRSLPYAGASRIRFNGRADCRRTAVDTMNRVKVARLCACESETELKALRQALGGKKPKG